ncbi:MAG: hypothetical protein Q9M14_05840 [Mariprofundaceae bacterium]|nr:hypothetical protein [Mariprofundaceae bacterium]
MTIFTKELTNSFLKSIPQSLARLALIASLLLGMSLTACGGGATTGAATTITGSAGDGPVIGGAVAAIDANGIAVITTPANPVTDANAQFKFTVPAGTALPLTITVTGGKDTVTGLTQDFTLKTAVTTLPPNGTVIANINPPLHSGCRIGTGTRWRHLKCC